MIVPNRFKVPEVLKGKKVQRFFNSIHFLQRKEKPNFNCIILFEVE